MNISLKINNSNYLITVSSKYENQKIFFTSELVGITISTFNYRNDFKGESIEKSLELIAFEIVRAEEELMNI